MQTVHATLNANCPFHINKRSPFRRLGLTRVLMTDGRHAQAAMRHIYIYIYLYLYIYLIV